MQNRRSPARFVLIAFTLQLAAILIAITPAQAQSTGAVYVNTNDTNNQVWSYTRATDGTLSFGGSYATQGGGSNHSDLRSQSAIALSQNGKFLFVVNAGSNEITSFTVHPGAQLTFASKVASGGKFPNSLASFGNLLYVLNRDGTSNITAFRVGTGGVLKPLANSTRTLSTQLPVPTQVGFSHDGKLLVVIEKSNRKIDTFTIGTDGRATGPQVQNSAGFGPFGFAFDQAGHLIVSETRNSTVSSYSVSPTGVITNITSALTDFATAACWVAITNNAALPNQYSFITNTSADSISAYTVASDGSLSLTVPDGKTFVLPKGAYPIDEVISSDQKYLYVLEGTFMGVVGFQINADGSLTQVTQVNGTSRNSFGMTGN